VKPATLLSLGGNPVAAAAALRFGTANPFMGFLRIHEVICPGDIKPGHGKATASACSQKRLL
jgi:hypothetical protein